MELYLLETDEPQSQAAQRLLSRILREQYQISKMELLLGPQGNNSLDILPGLPKISDGQQLFVLNGGPCRVGVESTIVDVTGERPRLLRPGGITPEQLRELLGQLDIDKAVVGEISGDTVVRAPPAS